ncbi:MAG: hypothetical protein JNK26_02990 [Candidatus Doudnabacteria bacterium]|nr:hypothetical protein [Candidatus Doudnabacteria bacterium]
MGKYFELLTQATPSIEYIYSNLMPLVIDKSSVEPRFESEEAAIKAIIAAIVMPDLSHDNILNLPPALKLCMFKYNCVEQAASLCNSDDSYMAPFITKLPTQLAVVFDGVPEITIPNKSANHNKFMNALFTEDPIMAKGMTEEEIKEIIDTLKAVLPAAVQTYKESAEGYLIALLKALESFIAFCKPLLVPGMKELVLGNNPSILEEAQIPVMENESFLSFYQGVYNSLVDYVKATVKPSES